jgi:predicted RNA-binding protein with PIN domain
LEDKDFSLGSARMKLVRESASHILSLSTRTAVIFDSFTVSAATN